jgi:ankyrin repeat protein
MSKKFQWDYGLGPLAKAAEGGNLAEVTKLIAEGASVNELDKVKRTPLYWAAQNGQTEVMKILLENGATVNMGDNTGYSPLYIAAQYKQLPAVKLLLEASANVNGFGNEIPLFAAITNKADDVALELINRGAEIEKQDINNETALYHSVREERSVVFRALMEKGADIYTQSFYNRGILPEAAQRACLDIVQMILARNPDKKRIQLETAISETDHVMERLRIYGNAQRRLAEIQKLLHAYEEQKKNGKARTLKRGRKMRKTRTRR